MTWFALLLNRTTVTHLPDAFLRGYFNSVAHVVEDNVSKYPTVVHESAFQSNDEVYKAVLRANLVQGLSGHKVTYLKEYINAYSADSPVYLDEGFLTRWKDADDSMTAVYESLRTFDLVPNTIYDEHYKTMELPFQTKMDSVSCITSTTSTSL